MITIGEMEEGLAWLRMLEDQVWCELRKYREEIRTLARGAALANEPLMGRLLLDCARVVAAIMNMREAECLIEEAKADG